MMQCTFGSVQQKFTHELQTARATVRCGTAPHELAAQRIGADLLVPGDLSVTRGTLLAGGERVDVVYRRTNEDRLRDVSGTRDVVCECPGCGESWSVGE